MNKKLHTVYMPVLKYYQPHGDFYREWSTAYHTLHGALQWLSGHLYLKHNPVDMSAGLVYELSFMSGNKLVLQEVSESARQGFAVCPKKMWTNSMTPYWEEDHIDYNDLDFLKWIGELPEIGTYEKNRKKS